jgi:pSer/pThr/pTyr-binding forkhead associated (FHA) protein
MKVVLELQDQPSNVRRITVRHDIVIGRGSDCNLRLSAPQVSRRHCFLRVGRDSVSVTDLDSSNGTYVDGARITAGKRYDIADGAQLALGPIRFIIHMRAETGAADSAKVKIAAGAAKAAQRAEAGGDSALNRTSGDDSSSADRRSRIADSDVPMDYNMEQAGDSAEPHEATQDNLGDSFSSAGIEEHDFPGRDVMDSRLEIIDFGRRISDERVTAEETCAASQGEACGESKTTDDSEPRWESAIIDSSESPDDLDVLSMSDSPGANNRGDCQEISHADGVVDDCLAIDDSIDTVIPQPCSETDVTIREETFVQADEFLDVDVADDLEIADADVADDAVDPTDEASAERVQSADDEIDPDLRNFLKGF